MLPSRNRSICIVGCINNADVYNLCKLSPVLLKMQSDHTSHRNYLLQAVQGDHSQIINIFTDFKARRDNYDHLV